ncbi:hypothetical protein J3L16_08455 [Alteromonas sp. 5E99-2]|uniref:hypothetical protein n=1 Tax=Alteromonas sp. 5E99-2 TaxID=2817683 RepID=UPI001A99A771|nr:hypothetical protein [Alteromonas sp. 5E99-2]MBO1255713.1 hypothetical protein [Alteromonas sp. 5E99-2]
MLVTVINNLYRIRSLTTLSPEDYSDKSAGPYYSSIGGHVRHILDIFNCLINGLNNEKIDLTARVRGKETENDPLEAQLYLDKTIEGLSELKQHSISQILTLIDDLGDGKVSTPATLGNVIFQAHSHAIHHFAIIGYILHIRKLTLPDTAFGYNPTTPINLVKEPKAS